MLRGIPLSPGTPRSISWARTGAHPKASATKTGRAQNFRALDPVGGISPRKTIIGQSLFNALLRRLDTRTIKGQRTRAQRQQYYEPDQQLPTHQRKSLMRIFVHEHRPPLWRNWCLARKCRWRNKAKEV